MNLEDMSVLHRLMPYLGVSEKKREQVEAALSLRFSCMEELLLASRASLAEAGI